MNLTYLTFVKCDRIHFNKKNMLQCYGSIYFNYALISAFLYFFECF